MFAVPTRAVRGQPDGRARAQAAADPARRPRAELLDVDGAPGRLVRRQPLRVDRGRHRRAVGSAARRREPGRDRDARRRSATRRRRAATAVARAKDPERRLPALGLRPPRLQELRPAGPDPARTTAERVLDRARLEGLAVRHRARARAGRAHRRVLHRAEAVPERRLLLGPDLPGDGLPHEHVPGAVRDRPAPRLDRALEGRPREPEDEDRSPAPDLHRPDRAQVRPDRGSLASTDCVQASAHAVGARRPVTGRRSGCKSARHCSTSREPGALGGRRAAPLTSTGTETVSDARGASSERSARLDARSLVPRRTRARSVAPAGRYVETGELDRSAPRGPDVAESAGSRVDPRCM